MRRTRKLKRILKRILTRTQCERTLKVYKWILMKHTWWNWHTVPGTAYWNMGHTAGTLRKMGIYFVWRNNWHIDVPWNISKIFYRIYFFSVQHMVSILNCMIFFIVYYANCTYCELVYLIGTYIVQGFDIKLLKLVSTALTSFGILQVLQWSWECIRKFFFVTDTGSCSEVLKYALFLFLTLVDDTPWWKISIK